MRSNHNFSCNCSDARAADGADQFFLDARAADGADCATLFFRVRGLPSVFASLLAPAVGAAFAAVARMTTTLPTHDDPRTFKIIGAAFEVHRVLGSGFLELFYKDALAIELREREIPFRRELPCNIDYKGCPLRGDYKIDFVCFDEIVLEIKARSSTGPADDAQVINYLAASKLHLALLLNFGGDRVNYKRFVRT